jgi:membrane protein YqaA with SNARE-associated domain
MSESLSLWGLFASSFLAATVLPGGSEAVLYAVLKAYPASAAAAVAVATLGNTLGGMSSYVLGCVLPQRTDVRGGRGGRALALARRHGAPALLLSWVPLIGDALCVAAGWLRLDAAAVAVFIALGKLARYAAVAWLAA